MALADEDHKYLNEQFARVFEKIDKVSDKVVLDYKERDEKLSARIGQLEKSDKYQAEKLREIEAKAETSGAFAGKKEAVKWTAIITLALQLLVIVAEKVF